MEIVQKLVRVNTIDHELQKIAEKERKRVADLQVLTVIRHMLVYGNKSKLEEMEKELREKKDLIEASQNSTSNSELSKEELLIQVHDLRSEIEKVKHQFISQKASFESEIVTLKQKNEMLLKDQAIKEQQHLKLLQENSPSKKHSKIPRTQNSFILHDTTKLTSTLNAIKEKQSTKKTNTSMIADFSTAPYLKNCDSSMMSNINNTPTRMTRTPSPKKTPGMFFTSTPQSTRRPAPVTMGNPILQTTPMKSSGLTKQLHEAKKADSKDRLSTVLKSKTNSHRMSVGASSEVSMSKVSVKKSIFDDKELNDNDSIFDEKMLKLRAPHIKRKSSEGSGARKRKKLGGGGVLETDAEADKENEEKKHIGKALNSARNLASRQKMMGKLGRISPLKKNNGFAI